MAAFTRRSCRFASLLFVGTSAAYRPASGTVRMAARPGPARLCSSPRACSAPRARPPGLRGARAAVGLPKGVDWGDGDDGRSFVTSTGRVALPEPFTVLGIETSCDDTGVAVVRSDGTILGEALASQAELHEAWGGVVPGLARDAHVAALGGAIELALSRAGMGSAAEVDAVAVTVGPGLEICLRVGAEEAKRLALAHGKPFVAIHHLEAHVLMARLACQPPPPFPFLTLLVSGGHCQLLLSRGVGDHLVIGSTLDDALGEAYDKARNIPLGLGRGKGRASGKHTTRPSWFGERGWHWVTIVGLGVGQR
eukprot:scaffold23494_cov101-Isochrysis_galbana.AAC.1